MSLCHPPVMDLCQVRNGGCAEGAMCSQQGDDVRCTCPRGHHGDGFLCLPIDPCASGDNGGCHEHATCTLLAPVRMMSSTSHPPSGCVCVLANRCVCACVRGRGSAAVRTSSLETGSAVNSACCQSAAVSRTTGDVTQTQHAPTSTLKVSRRDQSAV